MASHKTLKSVVTSVAESFTSLMNYSQDDYVLGHIVQAAWATGGTELRVDLLSGEAEPSPLLIPLVREDVAWYVQRFREIVTASNSDMQFVSAASLVVSVDPNKRRPHEYAGARFEESPFSCTVRVVDDRGRVYEHTVTGWWYPENRPGEGVAASQAALEPGI